MKNNIVDLNDHLFAQIERLGDEELKGEDLKNEIQRGKVLGQVARQIVDGAKVAIDAQRLVLEYKDLTGDDLKLPAMIENKSSSTSEGA